MSTIQARLKFAQSVARKAGEKLKEEFQSSGRYEFSLKGKADIVTEADKIAEEIIIGHIRQEYPNDTIFSEESGKDETDSDLMWIVDPLDGTTNFSIKMPFFNTAIAITQGREIKAGVVFNPIEDEMYMASEGNGTTLNGRNVSPNENSELKSTFHSFCYGKEMRNKLDAAKYYKITKQKGMPARQLGAGALELARIASGILDSFYNPGAKVWDVAAGAIIVKEAGGVVTDLNGSNYDLESDGILAASNSLLHEKLMKLIPS
jgi:myo-inositol-1(or 4)-monophosphatase